MHIDAGSLISGLLLGVSVSLYSSGATLIRHGVVRPKAWSNPSLSTRTQGKGLLLCGAVFTAGALGYLFSAALGGLVVAVGVLVLYLIDRRYKRASVQPEPSTLVQDPPSGGASGEGHPSGR